MTLIRKYALQLAFGATLALAGVSGAFVASAISAGSQATPQRTVTINAGAGATGAQGAQGPKGEAGATGPAGPAGGGAESCPVGSSFGKIVVNTPAQAGRPGGHVEFLTCIVNG